MKHRHGNFPVSPLFLLNLNPALTPTFTFTVRISLSSRHFWIVNAVVCYPDVFPATKIFEAPYLLILFSSSHTLLESPCKARVTMLVKQDPPSILIDTF